MSGGGGVATGGVRLRVAWLCVGVCVVAVLVVVAVMVARVGGAVVVKMWRTW